MSTYLDFFNRLHRGPYSNSGKRSLKPPAFSKEGITNAWAELLRREITALYEDLDIDPCAYHGPRQKSRNPHEAKLAKDVAQLLYPSPSHSTLPALIKYHHDHTLLRRTVVAQQTIVEQRRMYRSKPTLKERILTQGPWDEANGPPWRLDGVPAYPMPVKVSTESSLAPFFDHLMHDGGFGVDGPGEKIKEPY
ncbi:MAG: hypothetical protein LQ339_005569 [Xanthoria mediterranea]|nr:MAG: hypothetical protein LQ339_005569 [Xanthoria mediterranea]